MSPFRSLFSGAFVRLPPPLCSHFSSVPASFVSPADWAVGCFLRSCCLVRGHASFHQASWACRRFPAVPFLLPPPCPYLLLRIVRGVFWPVSVSALLVGRPGSRIFLHPFPPHHFSPRLLTLSDPPFSSARAPLGSAFSCFGVGRFLWRAGLVWPRRLSWMSWGPPLRTPAAVCAIFLVSSLHFGWRPCSWLASHLLALGMAVAQVACSPLSLQCSPAFCVSVVWGCCGGAWPSVAGASGAAFRHVEAFFGASCVIFLILGLPFSHLLHCMVVFSRSVLCSGLLILCFLLLPHPFPSFPSSIVAVPLGIGPPPLPVLASLAIPVLVWILLSPLFSFLIEGLFVLFFP